MASAEFDRLVERALASIPARFRVRMKNVALVVERTSEPPAAMPGGGTLLGLYQGRPLTGRSVFESFACRTASPSSRGRMNAWRADPAHLEKLVEETVWHEIAHYFGMDEKQVRQAERRRGAQGSA